MPPSCQLPSASIPTREMKRREERDSVKSQRLGLFRKEEKGRREKRKIEKTNVQGCMFSFLGGRKGKESLWIWVSLC